MKVMVRCPRCGYPGSNDPMRTVRVSNREMETLIKSETARPSEPPTVPEGRGVVGESEPEFLVERAGKIFERKVLVSVAIIAFVVALGILIASGIAWR